LLTPDVRGVVPRFGMGLRRSCKSERPTRALQPLPGSRPAAIRGSRPKERRSRRRALAPTLNEPNPCSRAQRQ
jgi:hypothetical protein